jgi:hypothetical protein
VKFLLSIRYYLIKANLCVFINNAGLIILAYVNNLIIITCTKAKIATLKKQLFSKFKCYDFRLISYYLSIRIYCNY